MNICGIDPGFSGAITFLNKEGRIVFKTIMPIIKFKVGKKKKIEYDSKAIRKLMIDYKPKMTAIEVQQAMPKQGVSSTFKTGRGFGLLEGIMIGLGYSYLLIRAQAWQKEMFAGYPKSEGKTLSKKVATMLAPNEDFKRTNRCSTLHDGLTDSYLISEFTRRKIK